MAREVLQTLEEMGDPSRLEGMARYGIRTDHAVGVTVTELRHLARGLRPHHELAAALWASGIHEARILASLVDEPARVSQAQMDAWVADLDSWDVCDGVCGNLFDRTPFALDKAVEWSTREPELEKRAAFALMASAAVHRRDLPDAAFASLLPVIREQASDDRNYVKKAVSGAAADRQAQCGAQRAGHPDRRADRADRCPIRQMDRPRRPPRASERRGAGAPEGTLT